MLNRKHTNPFVALNENIFSAKLNGHNSMQARITVYIEGSTDQNAHIQSAHWWSQSNEWDIRCAAYRLKWKYVHIVSYFKDLILVQVETNIFVPVCVIQLPPRGGITCMNMLFWFWTRVNKTTSYPNAEQIHIYIYI